MIHLPSQCPSPGVSHLGVLPLKSKPRTERYTVCLGKETYLPSYTSKVLEVKVLWIVDDDTMAVDLGIMPEEENDAAGLARVLFYTEVFAVVPTTACRSSSTSGSLVPPTPTEHENIDTRKHWQMRAPG